MIGFALRLLIVAFGLWLASTLVPGIEVQGLGTLLAAALLLGIVNAIVRPLIIILTLPITVLTLGVFLLVINAAMLGLVAMDVRQLHHRRFWVSIARLDCRRTDRLARVVVRRSARTYRGYRCAAATLAIIRSTTFR